MNNLIHISTSKEKTIPGYEIVTRPSKETIELTEEEHRTGEYEDGKKNQSLWHDNTIESQVHGEGKNLDQERKAHWKARSEQSKE